MTYLKEKKKRLSGMHIGNNIYGIANLPVYNSV